MNSKQLAIKLFETTRDIPYRIPLSINEPDNTCHGKSKMLFSLLKSYGFDAKIMLCSFKWSSLHLPNSIKSLIKKDDAYHAFIEIKLGEKWIRLDPTLDKGLAGTMPVNEWNGESDTRIAVIPIQFFSQEESENILSKYRSEENVLKEIDANTEAYKMLNAFYDSIREGK